MSAKRVPQSGKRSSDPIINILRDERYKALGYQDEFNVERYDKAVAKAVNGLITEAYKKGHIDGAIEVVNGTCSICGSYPMTANCNNAGCDT